MERQQLLQYLMSKRLLRVTAVTSTVTRTAQILLPRLALSPFSLTTHNIYLSCSCTADLTNPLSATSDQPSPNYNTIYKERLRQSGSSLIGASRIST
eukprot:scaffold2201_cov143-Skeletonema_menzelii.AAC.10